MKARLQISRRVAGLAVAAMLACLAAPPSGFAATVPALTVTLSPGAPDSRGDIPYLDVKIVADAVDATAGQPFLRLPLVSSNVQGIADALTGFRATDAKGPLKLTTHDDPADAPAGYRHWAADRTVLGPLVIEYRVPITNALNARGAAPPLELRTEEGGFSGSGGIFLVLPESTKLYRNAVRWNLAAAGPQAIGLSTLGAGDVTSSTPTSADALASTYFMGGNIHHFPDVLPAGGFSAVWQGEPPFDAHALMQWTQTLYGSYLKFFHAPASQPYAVFLRRNPVNAGGGVEIGHSFVGTFDKNTKTEDLKLTLAHEMVHTFVGALSGDDELGLSWYSEGLAVYYQRLLPLRAGVLSPAQYLADLNQTAARYYTDLLNDAPNDQISAKFWADTRIRVLPYDRGAMYFALLNSEIRKASGGKRSLDDPVLAMVERRRYGLPVDTAAWVKLVEHELGSRGKEEFEAMLAGKLVVPAPDSFGPCYTRTTAPLRRYELGFDSVVLTQPSRIVRGLVPGSAADRAGLRNGDIIVKPVPQDAIQADQKATLRFLIRRDGKEFPITYLPRGETVQAYQWTRIPTVPEQKCRAW